MYIIIRQIIFFITFFFIFSFYSYASEQIFFYKTNIGSADLAQVKIGVSVLSVDIAENSLNDSVQLIVNVSLKNYGNIPLDIGIGNKYLIDGKNNKYGACDGTGGLLNPGLKNTYKYFYEVPEEILGDRLYLAYIGYIDTRNQNRGFEIKWKVGIGTLLKE